MSKNTLTAVKKRLDNTLGATRVLRGGRGTPTASATAKFLGKQVRALLKDTKSWLPDDRTHAQNNAFTTYLLLRSEHYSLLSLVWPSGAIIVPHNHLVAGAIGVYKGQETETKLTFNKADSTFVPGQKTTLQYPQVGTVYPDAPGAAIDQTDWHTVINDGKEEAGSLHLYAADFTKTYRNKVVDGKIIQYTSVPADLNQYPTLA